MDLKNLTYIWNFCPGHKTRSQYIPIDVVDSGNMSSTQKTTAKKAIVWLLSKAAHSVDEIADHFEISPVLAGHLVEELLATKIIYRESGPAKRYRVKSDNSKVGEVS